MRIKEQEVCLKPREDQLKDMNVRIAKKHLQRETTQSITEKENSLLFGDCKDWLSYVPDNSIDLIYMLVLTKEQMFEYQRLYSERVKESKQKVRILDAG